MLIKLMAIIPSVLPASVVRSCWTTSPGVSIYNSFSRHMHTSAHAPLYTCACPAVASSYFRAAALYADTSRRVKLHTRIAFSGVSGSHSRVKASTQRKHRSTGQEGNQRSAVTPHPPPAPNCIDFAAAAAYGGVARVVLKSGKARLFRGGSPMVYGGAVDRVVGRPPPSTGDPVLLAASTGETIAWGIFNADSMFRVRIMQSVADATAHPQQLLNVAALIKARIMNAIALRRLLLLPSSETTVYRLINSEGDRLSGLVVDMLGTTLVVSSSSAFIELNRATILELLQSSTKAEHIVWRRSPAMLREEGLPDDISQPESNEEGNREVPQTAELLENGMQLLASPFGQKTGFYADQRDSRLAVRRLAAGRRVLDLCTYSGGFAISAALGGATFVIGVDSSAPALELARSNAELNGISPQVCDFRQEDIMDVMKAELAAGRHYDLVILDPPKLAPNRKSLQRALSRYRALNSAAMRLIPEEGGLLMTCSCSGAVTQNDEFLPMLQNAAAVASRRIVVVRHASAAGDHPLDPAYPEGAYLSNFLLRVL